MEEILTKQDGSAHSVGTDVLMLFGKIAGEGKVIEGLCRKISCAACDIISSSLHTH